MGSPAFVNDRVPLQVRLFGSRLNNPTTSPEHAVWLQYTYSKRTRDKIPLSWV